MCQHEQMVFVYLVKQHMEVHVLNVQMQDASDVTIPVFMVIIWVLYG